MILINIYSIYIFNDIFLSKNFGFIWLIQKKNFKFSDVISGSIIDKKIFPWKIK